MELARNIEWLGAARKIRGGEEGEDAGCGPRFRHVEPFDPGVRVETAHEDRFERSRKTQIGEKPAAAAEQTVVFEAPDGSTDLRHS